VKEDGIDEDDDDEDDDDVDVSISLHFCDDRVE
jgi:hypothetical protein